MKNIINWFKYHWQQRIFKSCTLIALLDIYLLIFHFKAYTNFLNQLADPLAHNQIVVGVIAGAVAAFFAWIKK